MKYGLLVLLFLILCTYLPNSGGSAISLPYNLLFLGWFGIALIAITRNKKINLSVRNYGLITGGAGLLLIPWIVYARDNCGGWTLLAALIIWLGITRITLKGWQKKTLLALLLLLALGQAVIGLLQTFFPHLATQLYEYDWLRNHGRPYGIFQQVNLFATFLASGLGCGVLLLFQLRQRKHVLLCIAGLAVLVFVLVLSQSRAGEIGAVVMVVTLSALLWRTCPARTVAALVLMTFSAAAAWYVTQHTTVLVDGVPYPLARSYEESTHERWHILRITWQMIKEKPCLGWGYGTFEYQFSRYVIAHPALGYTYSSIVTHPHNELLFAWYQGGVVALLGMLTLFAGWLSILVRAVRHSRRAAGYALLILPLLVHLNLEYPFYQSFVHLGLFMLLLRLGIIDGPAQSSHAVAAAGWMRLCYGACGLLLLVFSSISLYTQLQLTHYERSGYAHFPSPAPWYFATQFERVRFDAMIALLMDYNVTHNGADLDRFMAEAERWSQWHNDSNVWRSMMMITEFRGEQQKRAQLEEMYRMLFPRQAADALTAHSRREN